LTGWDIDILTEQEESERRQKEFAERSQLFMEALDVDEVIAQLLATEGFESVAEVAFVDAGEVAHIEGSRRGHRQGDPVARPRLSGASGSRARCQA
jgi:N utilization substance protein A